MDACTGQQIWHTQLDTTLTSTPSVMLVQDYLHYRGNTSTTTSTTTTTDSTNSGTGAGSATSDTSEGEEATPLLFSGSSTGELIALDARTGLAQFRAVLVGEKSGTYGVV